MNITLKKDEKKIRAKYVKAFGKKLYLLELDFMPWLSQKNKRIRKTLAKKVAYKRKKLRNGKLF